MQLVAKVMPYDFLGSPEGELAIAQAVIYLATAPKYERRSTRAFGAGDARGEKAGGSLLPPKHILNSPTQLMRSEGYGSAAATNTTTMRRTHSPARTASRKPWVNARPFTIRPTAA